MNTLSQISSLLESEKSIQLFLSKYVPQYIYYVDTKDCTDNKYYFSSSKLTEDMFLNSEESKSSLRSGRECNKKLDDNHQHTDEENRRYLLDFYEEGIHISNVKISKLSKETLEQKMKIDKFMINEEENIESNIDKIEDILNNLTINDKEECIKSLLIKYSDKLYYIQDRDDGCIIGVYISYKDDFEEEFIESKESKVDNTYSLVEEGKCVLCNEELEGEEESTLEELTNNQCKHFKDNHTHDEILNYIKKDFLLGWGLINSFIEEL